MKDSWRKAIILILIVVIVFLMGVQFTLEHLVIRDAGASWAVRVKGTQDEIWYHK